MNIETEPIPRGLKILFKVWCYGVLSIVGLILFTAISVWVWLHWPYRGPSEQWVRHQFELHRNAYVQAVATLEKVPDISYVDGKGTVEDIAEQTCTIPEYGSLVRATGAEHVEVCRDGALEFVLARHGSTLFFDSSTTGLRYIPKEPVSPWDYDLWPPQIVSSLERAKLPHTEGKIVTGRYVTAIEPGWFVYRFEYHEKMPR